LGCGAKSGGFLTEKGDKNSMKRKRKNFLQKNKNFLKKVLTSILRCGIISPLSARWANNNRTLTSE
jgi:hypothetical protein